MNKLYMILGLAVIILVLIRVYVRAERMSFEGFAGGSDAEIVIAKWKDCGHCVKAAPEFEKLKEEIKKVKLRDGSSVTVRILDADTDKGEISSLGIRGYPTILFFKDGQRFEYEGARTSDGIIQFLSGY